MRRILVGDPFHQLAGLLHYRHIRGKIRIQHIVGAKPAEECDHFPLHKAAVRHAEFLAQGNAHGRRGAENDNLAGIPDRRPD